MTKLSKLEQFQLSRKDQSNLKGGSNFPPTLPPHPGLPDGAANGNVTLPEHPGLPELPTRP